VEQAPVDELLTEPEHPYTVGLIGSVPRLGTRRERLATIAGTVPSLDIDLKGCRFADRCPFAVSRCREEAPPLAEVSGTRKSRCIRSPLARLVA
jgi:peptide/nickel transport system ATP-binding protein